MHRLSPGLSHPIVFQIQGSLVGRASLRSHDAFWDIQSPKRTRSSITIDTPAALRPWRYAIAALGAGDYRASLRSPWTAAVATLIALVASHIKDVSELDAYPAIQNVKMMITQANATLLGSGLSSETAAALKACSIIKIVR